MRLLGSQPYAPSPNLLLVFNGTTAILDYDLGFAYSSTMGRTWTIAPDPIITKGSAGTWNDESVFQPSMFWDSVRSRWVLYAAGHNGSIRTIGRWFNTNADLVANPTTWTQDVGNPILTPGGGYSQVNIPAALFEEAADITRVWYTGWGAKTSIGYAEVVGTSGTLSGVGEVIPVGAAGTFCDEGIVAGPILKLSASLWRIYVAGQQGTTNPDYRVGYSETTDPDNPAAYTTAAVLASLNSNITLAGDGRTYRSSYLTSVIALANGTYLGFGTAFHPTDASGDEVSFMTTSLDALDWSAPVGPIIQLGDWFSESAENPTVLLIP